MFVCKCEHLQFNKMTNQQIKMAYIPAYTEYHGKVYVFACKDCKLKMDINKAEHDRSQRDANRV
jgi:hypothetical protein